MNQIGIDAGAGNIRLACWGDSGIKFYYRSVEGQPIQKTLDLIKDIPDGKYKIGITGVNGRAISEDIFGVRFIIDPVAVLKGLEHLLLEPRTVIDIGKENSSYYLFDKNNTGLYLVDFAANPICGAGGGALIEKMAKRLQFPGIEDFVRVAYDSKSISNISARCAVFAESDVVHHFQRGSSVDGIAAGLCQVLARNFANGVCKDKQIIEPIIMLGGVGKNQAVVKFLEQQFGKKINVPVESLEIKCLGAAIAGKSVLTKDELIEKLSSYKNITYSNLRPLVKQAPIALPYEVVAEENGNRVLLSLNKNYKAGVKECFIGLDVGSVSTKASLLDREGNFLLGLYERTSGKPIDAVIDVIKRVGNIEIDGAKIKDSYKVLQAGVTGSGRYIAAQIIGADVVKNEITAQAKAAAYFFPDVDTVFEIGGQDSKYIYMQNGAVIESEMNKVCAASTGSFLEEQAKILGIKIEKQFGALALKSTNPCSLSEKCAVLMESSLLSYQDSLLEDKLAGLAYAICYNYLNRVVGKKPIGDKIVFQGAVAFNPGAASGFETTLEKKVNIPNYPHLTGAIGIAEILKEGVEGIEEIKTEFKGFDSISNLKYEQRVFQCKSCDNTCDVSAIKVGNSALYYGDRCEKYSGLGKEKEQHENMFDQREKFLMSYLPQKHRRKIITIPRTGMFNEMFPFWATFFDNLGLDIEVTGNTNKKIIKQGLEKTTADFCFPFKVAFGHYAEAASSDLIFSPDVIETFPSVYDDNGKLKEMSFDKSYTCPYWQNIGAVVSKNSVNGNMVNPHVTFRQGKAVFVKSMSESIDSKIRFSKKDISRAYDKALESYSNFKYELREMGKSALDTLPDKKKGIVIVGRPYAIYDPGVSLNFPKKVVDNGFVPIPMDFLPLPREDLALRWGNEFSIQGQQILSAANVIKREGLNAVFLDYFSCGPNSFIKHFFAKEINKPYLTIQIDEHTADAGVVTRLEAFLDTVK